MEIERRKHPRCRLADEDVFVLDQCSDKVATLIDLSIGGMKLSYSPEKFACNQWASIDIYAGKQNRLLIAGLTCEIVYDAPSLMENGSFRGIDVRTCGVRFNELTEFQKDNLSLVMACAVIE